MKRGASVLCQAAWKRGSLSADSADSACASAAEVSSSGTVDDSAGACTSLSRIFRTIPALSIPAPSVILKPRVGSRVVVADGEGKVVAVSFSRRNATILLDTNKTVVASWEDILPVNAEDFEAVDESAKFEETNPEEVLPKPERPPHPERPERPRRTDAFNQRYNRDKKERPPRPPRNDYPRRQPREPRK